jgi:hypothetical protein
MVTIGGMETKNQSRRDGESRFFRADIFVENAIGQSTRKSEVIFEEDEVL